tara:strand:+ start:590 stop:697 length:108 start_codon:yes stop_codon:yes gene_type:complete
MLEEAEGGISNVNAGEFREEGTDAKVCVEGMEAET